MNASRKKAMHARYQDLVSVNERLNLEKSALKLENYRLKRLVDLAERSLLGSEVAENQLRSELKIDPGVRYQI